MKIHYIYIEDFGVLKQLGFNLVGKYFFHYNRGSGKFSMRTNSDFIPNFYNIHFEDDSPNAEIESLSAIVGQNGVGKSTFLTFIKSNFPEGVGGFDSESIIVYEDDDQVMHIAVHESLEIDKSSIRKFQEKGFILHLYGPKKITLPPELSGFFRMEQKGEIQAIEDITIVNLSTYYDGSRESEVSGLLNISTNHLIREIENNYVGEEGQNQTQRLGLIDQFNFEEIYRELSFIEAFRSESQSLLGFNLPGEIVFSLQPIPNNKRLKSELEVVESLFFDISTNENPNKFVKYFFILVYFNIHLEFEEYSNQEFFELSSILSSIQITEDSLSLLHIIESVVDQTVQQIGVIQSITERLNALKELCIQLYNSLLHSDHVEDFDNALRFNITSSEGREEFSTFFSLCKSTYNLRSYGSFAWRDMSTGEKMLLKVFSRLYYVSDFEIERRGANLKLKKNVILLIDEGESHMHPTWQRQYVTRMLKTLPKILVSDAGQKRRIQIILTSNSPFILSDILSCNTVFLKKSESDKVIALDSLEDSPLTFAANIHRLLADGFFMDAGTMGEFAEMRINQVIDSLVKGKRMTLNELKRIRMIISQIGEPILRTKLSEMYSSKYNLNIHERLDRIEREIGLNDD